MRQWYSKCGFFTLINIHSSNESNEPGELSQWLCHDDIMTAP